MNELSGNPEPDQERPEAGEPSPGALPEHVPIILSASTVMYPQQLIPVLATEQRDIQAIDHAASSEAKTVGVFPQQATGEGVYDGPPCEVGTAASIGRMAKAPDGRL